MPRILSPPAPSRAQYVKFFNAFNAPLSWLRALSYLEAISPRTRQLTLTIARAWSDLATLMVRQDPTISHMYHCIV